MINASSGFSSAPNSSSPPSTPPTPTTASVTTTTTTVSPTAPGVRSTAPNMPSTPPSMPPAPPKPPIGNEASASTSFTPVKKKGPMSLKMMILGAVMVLIVAALGIGLYLQSQSQDVRQQASVGSQFTEAKDCSFHGDVCKCTFCVPGQPFNCQWDESGSASGGRCGTPPGGGGTTSPPPASNSNTCSTTSQYGSATSCAGVAVNGPCIGSGSSTNYTCQKVQTESQTGYASCGCVVNPGVTNQPGGSPCSTNSNCASNSCVNNVCTTLVTTCNASSTGGCSGKGFGASCGTNGSCNGNATNPTCTCSTPTGPDPTTCSAASDTQCVGKTPNTSACTTGGLAGACIGTAGGPCTCQVGTGGAGCIMNGNACGTTGNGYCQLQVGGGFTCDQKKITGATCSIGYQCQSGTCSNGICTGNTQGCTTVGQSCNTSTGQGGFCSQNTGTGALNCAAKLANGTGCTYNYMCQSNICNVDGKCAASPGPSVCSSSSPTATACLGKNVGSDQGICTCQITTGSSCACVPKASQPPSTGGSIGMCPNSPTTPVTKWVKFVCDKCQRDPDGQYRCYEGRQESTTQQLVMNAGECGQVDALSGDSDSTYCGYTNDASGYTCDQPQCQGEPPASTPPQSPPASAAGPMCLNITMAKLTAQGAPSTDTAAPKMGEAVRFTCGTVASISNYTFRVIEPDGTIVPLQATGNISAIYNISKFGKFSAQCQICTGTTASSCHPFAAITN